MGKNKLAKFADMQTYANVFEYPHSVAEQIPFEKRGCWNSSFFRNSNPIVIELGCGRGEYTVELAKLYPDRNFIGIDIKGARMWAGATQAIRQNITNVAFLRTNIEIIDRFFAAGEVSQIWLTFPDPQMKKYTKRLTSTPFLERYRKFLVPDGVINLKTDSNFMYTYTSAMVDHNNLPVIYNIQNIDVYLKDNTETELSTILNIRTYYEQQWRDRGMTIKYIAFSVPEESVLTEPEIEIELDTYRSYNRSKRSGLETSK